MTKAPVGGGWKNGDMTVNTCEDFAKWSSSLASRAAQGEGGCWLWTGPVDRKGYGKFRVRMNGRRVETGAHRVAWLVFRGDIPEGLVIDHLCRVRACVNPWHLDVVTVRVNTARGSLAGVVGRHRTGCTIHSFEDGYRVSSPDGYTRWTCRVCRRARTSRHRSSAA